MRRLALLLAVTSASCASGPKIPDVLVPPPFRTRVTHYRGTALTGPGTHGQVARVVDPRDVPAARCRLIWIEGATPDVLGPIASHVAHVIDTGSDTPIRAVPARASDIRIGTGAATTSFVAALARGELGAHAEIGTLSAALLPYGTVAFSIEHTARAAGRLPRLSVEITNRADAFDITLGAGTQIVMLSDHPAVGDAALALAVPDHDSGPRTLVLLVTLTAPPTDEAEARLHAHLVATAIAEARQTDRAARARARLVAPSEADRRRIETALAEIGRGDRRRAAVVFLAGIGAAPCAESFAFVAPSTELARLVDALQRGIEATAGALTPQALGLVLERAAYGRLTQLAGQDELGAALRGVLFRHAGEAARSPDAVLEIVRDAKSAADIEARLIDENLILLRDNDPAARVRALDWLAARNRAPRGFDPFASSKERRHLLEHGGKERPE